MQQGFDAAEQIPPSLLSQRQVGAMEHHVSSRIDFHSVRLDRFPGRFHSIHNSRRARHPLQSSPRNQPMGDSARNGEVQRSTIGSRLSAEMILRTMKHLTTMDMDKNASQIFL